MTTKTSPKAARPRVRATGASRKPERLASAKAANPDEPRFVLAPAPYARLVRKIGENGGRGVDAKELANEIRAHGVAPMPAEVVDYLCRFLGGEIEKRGRKPTMSNAERRLLGIRAADCYTALRRAQLNDPAALEAAVDFYKEHGNAVADSYSPSEAIWKITSFLLLGHYGHHKFLSNLASEFAPLNMRPERPMPSRE